MVISLNSHTTSRPPGRVTRRISSSASRVPCTFRRPNEIVTASKAPSLKGSLSASPAAKATRPLVLAWKGAFLVCLAWAAPHKPEREAAAHAAGTGLGECEGGSTGAAREVEPPVAGPRLEDALDP